jgi:viroplasmin and RNaseH domain-containing protein
MPQATITFDLNDSDEQMAHMRAVKSLDVCLALWEIMYNTKKKIYSQVEMLPDEVTKEDIYNIVDMMYQRYWEILKDKCVELDDLVV